MQELVPVDVDGEGRTYASCVIILFFV